MFILGKRAFRELEVLPEFKVVRLTCGSIGVMVSFFLHNYDNTKLQISSS